MINEPIKITNIETLQREKQRLKIYCSFKEEMLTAKIISIKLNFKQIIAEEFLPFNTEVNKKVSNVLDWINEFVMSKFLKTGIARENKLQGSLIKVAEVALIHLLSKFTKR